jgi:excisionase family DNA binding protein
MTKPNPPLDPWRFDAITKPEKPENLWGLAEIAQALGVSVDKARRLARLDHVPIYRPDGRSYFAFRSELMAWLRTKRR